MALFIMSIALSYCEEYKAESKMGFFNQVFLVFTTIACFLMVNEATEIFHVGNLVLANIGKMLNEARKP